jgi:hypothetical protein
MTDAWYYAEGEKAIGPVTLPDLEKRLALVSNAKEVLVWRDGFANWQRADSVSDLALLPTPPKLPPIPRSALRRIARWFLNLLGLFLAGASIGLFIFVFMPETRKALDETEEWQWWVLVGSSFAIAEIAVKILARFLPPKTWERTGKFLVFWLLILIGLALMVRF